MSSPQLLIVRKEQKRRKPWFVVKEAHHGGRVQWRWRAARGIHSYVRQRHRGRPALPAPGYGAPKAVRGLHPSGRLMVRIGTAAELLAVDREREGAVLSSTVGMKKRLTLLRLAQEKNVPMLNVSDLSQEIERLTTLFTARKEVKRQQKTEQQKKQGEKEKKAREKGKRLEQEEKGEEKDRAGSQKPLEEKQQEAREFAEKMLIKPQ